MAAIWKTGTYYSIGNVVNFGKLSYKCIAAHTSQVDWFPCIDTLSIWTPVPNNTVSSPFISIPILPVQSAPVVPLPPVQSAPVQVSPSPNKTILAPYLYTWGINNSAYKINCCMDIINKLHGNGVTIAFVLGDTSTKQMSTDIKAFGNDFANFIKAGGMLIISFGGAAGSYLEDVVSENDMVSQVSNLLDTTGCRALDFDIEGSYLANSTLNDKRAKVIARLQAKYPGLYISLTLPADTNGIMNDGKNCIINCISNGVNITIVNSMAMDLGSLPTGQSWGVTACKIGDTVVNQLRTIYTTKTTAQLYKMIGLTAMIGKNDDGTVFLPSDASILGTYAKNYNIGLVSFWSINRDQSGVGDLGVFSQANETDFQYFNNMKAALSTSNNVTSGVSGITLSPTPAVPPKTTTNPAWTNGVTYGVGNKVTYMGNTYVYTSSHVASLTLTPNSTPSLWHRL